MGARTHANKRPIEILGRNSGAVHVITRVPPFAVGPPDSPPSYQGTTFQAGRLRAVRMTDQAGRIRVRGAVHAALGPVALRVVTLVLMPSMQCMRARVCVQCWSAGCGS